MIRWPLEWPVGVGLGVAAFLAVRGADPAPALLALALALLLAAAPPVRDALERGLGGWAAAGDAPGPASFDDVGGQGAAKRELREALDFLRLPEAARRLGVRPLRGILLVGPPGTGKTLLARAAAAYTGSAFVSASGSEFVEMYAGVGARRVRDLFERARRAGRDAPGRSAIVFIDEMDVLGARRGSERHHLEYDQTLNQLLVEMDGLGRGGPDEEATVLVLGATNRVDLLDEALLRPGRFDRVVRVELPDRLGRLEILRLHARGRALAEDADLEGLARETFGLSGAHLESVLNEAAILALRAGAPAIGRAHLAEAVEKVIMGERLDRLPGREERRRVAVHEGGHALVAELLRPGSVAAITITSRGNALGYVRHAPGDDRYLRTRQELADDIAIALAGAVAEELVLGARSTGAQSDLAQAGETARRIVLSGMSRLGAVPEGAVPEGELFEAVRDVLAGEEARVRALLAPRLAVLESLAHRLLEEERLGGEAIAAALREAARAG
jgi:cell division protease FtsH